MTNFKKLAEQQGLLDKRPPDQVRARISGTLGLYELFGNLLDLFIPKAIGTLRDMLGARNNSFILPVKHDKFDISEKPKKYPNRLDINPNE